MSTADMRTLEIHGPHGSDRLRVLSPGVFEVVPLDAAAMRLDA